MAGGLALGGAGGLPKQLTAFPQLQLLPSRLHTGERRGNTQVLFFPFFFSSLIFIFDMESPSPPPLASFK